MVYLKIVSHVFLKTIIMIIHMQMVEGNKNKYVKNM